MNSETGDFYKRVTSVSESTDYSLCASLGYAFVSPHVLQKKNYFAVYNRFKVFGSKLQLTVILVLENWFQIKTLILLLR